MLVVCIGLCTCRSAAMIVSRENVVSGSVSHPPMVYIIYEQTDKILAV